MIGSHVSFDNSKGIIDNHSYTIGIEYPNYKASIHALNGGSSIMATIYQKFSSGAEAGCKVTHSRSSSVSLMEFGCKVPFDKQSFAKAFLFVFIIRPRWIIWEKLLFPILLV